MTPELLFLIETYLKHRMRSVPHMWQYTHKSICVVTDYLSLIVVIINVIVINENLTAVIEKRLQKSILSGWLNGMTLNKAKGKQEHRTKSCTTNSLCPLPPLPLPLSLPRAEGLTEMLLLVGCLASQQHASVSQGRICSDNFTCCHTEIEVADQTFHLTQSQYTDIGPTSPSTDPITPGTWQGSHWSANF